jgi:hypothetical protein
MLLPALGFQVMGVHMIAFVYGSGDSTDVVTIFDDSIADVQILERDLVADRHVLVDYSVKFAVVFGYDAQQVSAGDEILDDHDADIIAAIVS